MRAAERLAAAGACALAALGLSAPAALGAGVRAADRSLDEWNGVATGLGGHTQISRGELVHTDYLYDDYGADLDGVSNRPPFPSTTTARTSGDYRYSPEAEALANNGADLRELRLALDRRGLDALVALQTMRDPMAAIATIAIDADGDAATGSGAWPEGAGIETPGADLYLTVSGDGARLLDAAGATHPLSSSAHAEANAFEVDVPRALVGKLDSGARVWAGVGLRSPSGGYAEQAPGAPALFDLAFQGPETYEAGSSWSDQRQAAGIAGDPSPFSRPLRPAALRRERTRRFRPGPGFYNAVFRSARVYGEGIDLRDGGVAGSSAPEFLGRHQPYGLYIPTGYDGRRPAQLLLDLHSLNRNHNQYAGTTPNRLAQLGDQRRSVIVTPLGRSAEGWYLDAGLIDVLEAWRDARRRLELDPRRTSIAGYSMGGYGAYRLGLLMPDRFARAVTHVGPQIHGLWAYPAAPIGTEEAWRVASNTNLIVENALNLPYEINAGNADPIVPISGVVHQAETFAEHGNPFRFYRHDTDDHFSFARVDEWAHTRDWLGRHRLVRNPVRVRYRRYPAMDLPDGDLRFDGAYWVDRMVVRDDSQESSSGAIDATTEALGRRAPRPVAEAERRVAPGSGGASPATVTGLALERGAKRQPRNGFTARLENLKAVALNTRRMGLDPARPVRARLQGDGRTTLRLTGRWPERLRATANGKRIAIAGGRGARLRVVLEPGATRSVLIRPR